MIDSIDVKILNSLIENGRVAITKVARALSISNVATQQRVTKLEKSGVIRGYSVDIDYTKLGYTTVAYIGIFLEKAKNYESVIEEMKSVPEILEAHFTTGNYSIFAKIIAKDNAHLMQVLNNQIQKLDGISRTETFISLHAGISKSMKVN